MDYKYYIYKQAPVKLFDKYDWSQYVFLREITQLTQWSLKISRDREFFTVIRREFGGAITVSGDDYNALIALERDNKQYIILIKRYCNGVWEDFWKGYFSYFDFKVDMDKCQLSFEPTVWDEYSPVFDQYSVKYNILSADSDWSFRLNKYVYDSEVVTASYIATGIVAPTWSEYTGYAAGNCFYRYSRYYTFIECYDSGGGVTTCMWILDEVYKRDVYLRTSNTPFGTWVLDPLLPGGEVSPGLYKWVRPYLDSAYQTYEHNVIGDNESYVLRTSGLDYVLIQGCKRLSQILSFFADRCGLTYQSSFFNDSPCPMGGTSLDWTCIQQITNLRDVQETAVKGYMKLQDLLTWLRDTFNVYWYIDSAGEFRIEHRKYFDYGLSYTYTHVIELNLYTTYPDHIKMLNKYEWLKPELYRYENIEFTSSSFIDWVESKIEYPSNSIIGNETKTYNVSWGTDVNTLRDLRNELPKEGWVLYNIEPIAGIYWVKDTVGAITNRQIQNGRFSNANLMRDLWTYGRFIQTGYINGVTTTFDSIIKLKQQVELSFPQCCQDLDYNGLYRTELGDGLIDSAEYEAKSGNLKINLIYE